MEQKKIRLKGHETFILRDGWITKGLIAVKEDPKVFSDNYGADVLGVGSNMAKAIRYWLRESGLIEEKPKEGAHLTKIGHIIYDNDLYIEDIHTLWILHINLSLNADKVTSWYLFFNALESSEFSKEELTTELKERIMIYAGVDKIPERSLNDDVNALLNMYCREHIDNYDPEDKKVSPFVRLGLLKKSMNRYVKVQPSLDKLDEKVILYILCKYTKEHGFDNISIDDIVKKEGLAGKLCNLGRVSVNQYLDELAANEYTDDEGNIKSYITVNRTAGLDMVYINKIFAEEDIVKQFYY